MCVRLVIVVGRWCNSCERVSPLIGYKQSFVCKTARRSKQTQLSNSSRRHRERLLDGTKALITVTRWFWLFALCILIGFAPM